MPSRSNRRAVSAAPDPPPTPTPPAAPGAPASTPGLSPEVEASLRPEVRLALATWPQIDPAVEAILVQLHDAERILLAQMRESLAHVGLTMEEFKVVMSLATGPMTHGALCRELGVSTGAMTNRLDKLEREGVVSRAPDPSDRRGVLLSLTEHGRERLDDYADRGAHRERTLLQGLTATDKRRLNDLLAKLLTSLREQPEAG